MYTTKRITPCLFVLILSLVLALAIVVPALADEGPPVPPPEPLKGQVRGTGTHFEVTDSDYLNVTLDSSEPISLTLSSLPAMINLDIRPISSATSTQIILGGLTPSATFYKFEDDGRDPISFTADANGSYVYSQVLSAEHLVTIRPQGNTIHLRDDATGGQCNSIGTWNAPTKTCTLTQDVNDTITIESNYITLDGDGHTIDSPYYYGIYWFYVSGVTVKNLNITSTTMYDGMGLAVSSSSNNTITGVNVSDKFFGIQLGFYVHDTVITGNTLFANGSGIMLHSYNYNNTISDNTTSDNTGGGLYLYEGNWSNTFYYNTTSNNNYGIYLTLSNSSNTFYNNTISNNNWGMYQYRGWENLVYNNNFLNNINQVYAYRDNIWNVNAPDGGNYWSNYDTPGEGCYDTNNDNFCDAALYVPYDGYDYLPWTTQNGWLDSEPPAVTKVLASPNPAPSNTGITLSATVDDSSTGNSDIASAEYSLDGGDWLAMTASDGDFDSSTEYVEATISGFPESGVHGVCTRGTDASGYISSGGACTILSVYEKLLALDGVAYDFFGERVAVDGDTAVVGVAGDDDRGINSGSAYVFVRNGTSWTQQAKLLASDGAAGDNFGRSVAVSGDTVVIGADGDDDRGLNSGSAYVFVRSGTSWTQQAKLLASDGAAWDLIGRSVAVEGDTVLVGAAWDDEKGFDSGSTYVFVRSGTGWIQQAKLMPSDGAEGDFFGHSVAVSGDTAVIGAVYDDDKGLQSGSVYVFVRSRTSWTQQAKLLASDGEWVDTFGESVAVDRDTAVVGAPGDNDKGLQSGSVYIFVRDGTNWIQQAKLLAYDGASDDNFGSSVALDGNAAVIGAYGDDSGDNDQYSKSGSAYVFVRSGISWAQQAKLSASDGATEDYLGSSVAVSGGTALIGAMGDDDRGPNSGSAYAFGIIDVQPPLVTNVLANPISAPSNTAITVSANVDDSSAGNSVIISAEYRLDGGDWLAMMASDGGFDSPTEIVQATISGFSEAGVHEFCVRGTDANGIISTGDDCTHFAVYDPDGGFVSGGGWINSPKGAYKPDASLAGKATFGFVSEYKKGAEAPTGDTEFQFHAAELNFHSNSYEWLVVTGSNYARFKGVGTINGTGDYKFMLWAGDENPDTFRIRIWEEDETTGVERDVYDNGFDQDIGGGSIVIHTAEK